MCTRVEINNECISVIPSTRIRIHVINTDDTGRVQTPRNTNIVLTENLYSKKKTKLFIQNTPV